MDSPANGRVTYYIIGGDKLSHFKMEKYSGYLTVATALDRESVSSFCPISL